MKKNKGYALHIGLNAVNSEYYRGWEGKLPSCEADALAMQQITTSQHYLSIQLLLTEAATKEAFRQSVTQISTQMEPGDLCVITYSGHGGQVLDQSGDETDKKDETWCFYDGDLVDDEIHELLKKFKKGTRVLILSDSCFSGTIFKNGEDTSLMWGATERVDLSGVEAAVRLISSSQENELSRGNRKHGLFTESLLEVWADGEFEGNYQDLYEEIVSYLPYNVKQTPNHLMGGAVDEAFDNSNPFEV